MESTTRPDLKAAEPKHRQGPKIQPVEPVTAPVDLKVNDDWHPIDDAIKDSAYYVYLKEDPQRAEWFWYKTRHLRNGRWEQTGWWRKRFGAPLPPSFEATGYRRISEGWPGEEQVEPKPAA